MSVPSASVKSASDSVGLRRALAFRRSECCCHSVGHQLSFRRQCPVAGTAFGSVCITNSEAAPGTLYSYGPQ